MKLGFEEPQRAYDSGSQRAKTWTETWVRDQAFCPNCGHVSMTQFAANRQVAVRPLMVVPKHFVRPEVIEERRQLGRMVWRLCDKRCGRALPWGTHHAKRTPASSDAVGCLHNTGMRCQIRAPVIVD